MLLILSSNIFFPFREMDRDVVGAAASIFIVSSIKVPNHTNELISTEMNHELPDQRINAILRFQVSSCHLKNDLICFLVYNVHV